MNTLIGNWALFLLIMLRLVGEMRAMAGRDALTGLLNRRGLRQVLDPLLAVGPTAAGRWACCCSISTISRPSTIPTATTWATRCWW
ncbi:hypothetical protein LP419_35155 [Massilia sp. H-1]|nr:hypothetical protein LP419_35155 [Massilia sp. H-1]